MTAKSMTNAAHAITTAPSHDSESLRWSDPRCANSITGAGDNTKQASARTNAPRSASSRATPVAVIPPMRRSGLMRAPRIAASLPGSLPDLAEERLAEADEIRPASARSALRRDTEDRLRRIATGPLVGTHPPLLVIELRSAACLSSSRGRGRVHGYRRA